MSNSRLKNVVADIVEDAAEDAIRGVSNNVAKSVVGSVSGSSRKSAKKHSKWWLLGVVIFLIGTTVVGKQMLSEIGMNFSNADFVDEFGRKVGIEFSIPDELKDKEDVKFRVLDDNKGFVASAETFQVVFHEFEGYDKSVFKEDLGTLIEDEWYSVGENELDIDTAHLRSTDEYTYMEFFVKDKLTLGYMVSNDNVDQEVFKKLFCKDAELVPTEKPEV